MRLFALFSLFVASLFSLSAQPEPKVEPPFWWTGMHVDTLQLMAYGDGIARTAPKLVYPGLRIAAIEKTTNPNYLFIKLVINDTTLPGNFQIDFLGDEKIIFSCNYTLLGRKPGSRDRQGFGPDDVIYLMMPDRFANGDRKNDNMPGMLEQADRSNPDGRHGGDLKGVRDHLGYFVDMGYTALWLNPLLENNNPKYSYHGYAITDFYRLDPRIGSNNEYVDFVDACHAEGIKVIMDMVFNHCGHGHWWMDDLPADDWIHQWPEFTRSNFRAPVNSDPHASAYDKKRMEKGWFDTNMPDLNQNNELLADYLIQNSIWWVEYAGLDGIRMDTYPYSDQGFMKRWMQRMQKEYPHFNIVGEAWLQKEAITSFYAGSEDKRFGYDSGLPSVTDFPMYYAISRAFNEEESWTEGMARLYYVPAQDFLYDDPHHNVIFADNHDLDRFYTSMQADLRKYMMGMAYLLTTRGIPKIYYGTEILMEGEEHQGHGYIREDFPGGWKGDKVNAFTGSRLSTDQRFAQQYLSTLLNWRKQALRSIRAGCYISFLMTGYMFISVFTKNRQ